MGLQVAPTTQQPATNLGEAGASPLESPFMPSRSLFIALALRLIITGVGLAVIAPAFG